ncbi:hypothetical protein SAMN05444411_1221 [Lutibacter oricola]|uniref:Uncharacterized protein n=1 Tax=Lutibacter oricola TaxID=762486 RepID=A0A1H3H0N6_9FLAO|nr:hypothetical protein [Lutibacter oricola]SDY08947.1 hypothetical protein SAMN05444411_1221 [Lutibacter oricola]
MIFLVLVYTNIYIKMNDSNEIMLSTKLNGVIDDNILYKGYTSIKMRGDSVHWKIEPSSNYDYNPNEFGNFIKKNDKLIKHRCSDTLFVIRNNKSYEFLIGDSSYNYEKRTKEREEYLKTQKRIFNENNDCND